MSHEGRDVSFFHIVQLSEESIRLVAATSPRLYYDHVQTTSSNHELGVSSLFVSSDLNQNCSIHFCDVRLSFIIHLKTLHNVVSMISYESFKITIILSSVTTSTFMSRRRVLNCTWAPWIDSDQHSFHWGHTILQASSVRTSKDSEWIMTRFTSRFRQYQGHSFRSITRKKCAGIEKSKTNSAYDNVIWFETGLRSKGPDKKQDVLTACKYCQSRDHSSRWSFTLP